MQTHGIKRFIECIVPSDWCNMKCSYCYITQNYERAQAVYCEPLAFCARNIGRAFRKSRLGGTCLVNLCSGGETLIPEEMPRIIKEILIQGHFVMVVTNGTLSEKFEELIKNNSHSCLKRLFFKFSFHYLELLRLGKMDVFFENVRRVKKAGCSFTLELTPDDSYLPYISQIQEICMKEAGAFCHVTVIRDERKASLPLMTHLPRNRFRQIWSAFDSELFRFKESVFGKKQTGFCYAGVWSMVVNIASGDYYQCYHGNLIGNIYDAMDKPLHFSAIGNHCREAHCFNAHAYMALGLLPNVQTPTYAQMRNRVCADGSEWLSPTVKRFFDTKLQEQNRRYSWIEQKYWNGYTLWNRCRQNKNR